MICTGLLIVCNLFANRYYPQIEDFLCGCDYCESLNKHEPLDIGFHIMQHKAWRDGLIKTMDLMNRKLDPFSIPCEIPFPTTPRKIFRKNKIMLIRKILQ